MTTIVIHRSSMSKALTELGSIQVEFLGLHRCCLDLSGSWLWLRIYRLFVRHLVTSCDTDLHHVGTCSVHAIKLVDVATGIALGGKLSLLLVDQHVCLGIVALLTQNILLNESMEGGLK